MRLLQCVQKFLLNRWDQKSPLLLGYSGGPDSKALLHLLLQMGVRPHLAHVDHGWRKESALQAQMLQKEAESLALPFYTIRLEPDRRESVAREQRLLFFASLYKEIPFQALLLAHQADDWAETTLKRTLEGAHLSRLSGLKDETKLRGMTIWRPLLSISRAEIGKYLQENNLQGIHDPTNLDPAYLRARMRTGILPSLSQSFGKEVSGNLRLLGARSQQLCHYLDRKTDAALQLLQKGPWGWALPPSLTEAVEIRHVLQRLDIALPRSILEGLVEALQQRRAHACFGPKFLADRGVFFYLCKEPPSLLDPLDLCEGSFTSGIWKIEVTTTREKSLSPAWIDLFCGRSSFIVPRGDYQLQMSHASLPVLRKRFNQRQIPAFLRPYIPCLRQKGNGLLIDLFRPPLSSDNYRVQLSVNTSYLYSSG